MSEILFITGIVIFVFFILVCVTSIFEKELRSSIVSGVFSILLPIPYILPEVTIINYPGIVEYVLLSVFAIPVILYILPVNISISYSLHYPVRRYDERDTMFSRRDLQPGSDRFNQYYEDKPDKKALDDTFRAKPGLLKAGSKYYDPILFIAAQSIFDRVDTLHPRVEGKVAEKTSKVDPEEMTRFILGKIIEWGGHSAGITELFDYHVYSYGGRGDRYGVEFEKEHKYAIAFTLEMDYDMMRAAPYAPTLVESANQYLRAGLIAIQIAEFIRDLGYPARAHIDGNYKVICPLVARDAGLGEIGRMGLLMTPKVGPRVRIAVVTTDMPLIVSKYKHDPTVIDFCRKCEKCADICPSKSIPFGVERNIDGVPRWQIHSESCFTYWCIAGTDCGRCVIVCPYSHPDNWFHRFIRFGVRNSFIFRRLAIRLDDLFYGKKPKPRK